MASVNLEKTLQYLKIQEGLQSEYLTEYYLCKGIVLYGFVYKVKQIIKLTKTLWLLRYFYDIWLKGYIEGLFLVT